MDRPELILNLWYLYDDLGAIYSLRARVYVGTGTDEAKLGLLRQFAHHDWLIAQPFSVPERFCVTLESGKRAPVAMCQAYKHLDDQMVLFEDAIRELQAQLPAQTELSIPQEPLVCLTPLYCRDDGEIEPRVRHRSSSMT